MSIFTIKRNDTRNALKAKLINTAGVATNLTNTTVHFIMSTRRNEVIINRKVIISDAVNGEVLVVFRPGDTGKVGLMRGEFRVMFADGNVETYPNSEYIDIYIESNLEGVI